MSTIADHFDRLVMAICSWLYNSWFSRQIRALAGWAYEGIYVYWMPRRTRRAQTRREYSQNGDWEVRFSFWYCPPAWRKDWYELLEQGVGVNELFEQKMSSLLTAAGVRHQRVHIVWGPDMTPDCFYAGTI